MLEWAKREIEIACKRERADNENPDGTEWDYGCACYDSALRAFQSLLGDSHSGFSIGMTKHILNRLIDGRPLTPIEDTDDVWNDITEYHPGEGYTNYQCKRMSSLFKYVYNDGTIKYRDIDSHYCIDINDNDNTYHSNLIQRLMDEMFPISMPYMPTEPTKVYCSDILTDRKNGDFDTVAIWHAIKPNGDRIEIYRYFKEGGDDWIEIDKAEYKDREKLAKLLESNIEMSECMPEFLNKKFNIPDEMKAVGPEISKC